MAARRVRVGGMKRAKAIARKRGRDFMVLVLVLGLRVVVGVGV